jgi:FMN reductase
MALIVAISGSPGRASRSFMVTEHVRKQLAICGFDTTMIDVRELPAEDVFLARGEAPAVREALALISRASAVVISTPVYKAAYTGALKSLLDLLPQSGLNGKVVFPLVTGGTLAHVLVGDYALRPVLAALGASHVVTSLFCLDKLLSRPDTDGLALDHDLARRLDEVIKEFVLAVRRMEGPVPGSRPPL